MEIGAVSSVSSQPKVANVAKTNDHDADDQAGSSSASVAKAQPDGVGETLNEVA